MAKPRKHGDKWRIRWHDEHGKRQSAVFDDRKHAQTELSRKQVEVEEIKRGIRNAAPPERTFGDVCDYWLDNRAPRKRSRKDDESIIRKHLRPAFGEMKLRDVGVEEGDAYVNVKIDDEGLSEKTVNNHVTLLTTMLRTATTFKVPWLLTVPKLRKPKVALFSRDFQWLRTDDEVRRFLAATRDEDEHVFAFYSSAIYTGMRAGEIAALEWSDVDFDRRLITVHLPHHSRGPERVELDLDDVVPASTSAAPRSSIAMMLRALHRPGRRPTRQPRRLRRCST